MAGSMTGQSVSSPYTGVVIVHGIGDEKRNETLEEVSDALTKWFTTRGGLAARPFGPSRIWQRPDFTYGSDPDAKGSRTVLEIEAPLTPTSIASDAKALRLELREVWWAQSFGAPGIGLSLRWARAQFREEALRVLLPAPTFSVAPTMTRSPTSLGEEPDHSELRVASRDKYENSASTTRQPTLSAFFWMYARIQYVWKLGQWLVLTPLLYLLLILIGLVRLLALIPAFTSGVLGATSRITGFLTLHWLGPLEAYLNHETRSASIRVLVDREIDDLIRDDKCSRIVVIAHSMGTVIAYDSLSTFLRAADVQHADKPVTFISLGQAIRRVWLVSGSQPNLRFALPKNVNWVNFWARYDPIAAGPLGEHSLPTRREWNDQTSADSYETMLKMINDCSNVNVVNTESLYTDHTTYWANLEEVVGPIARELVAGHEQLTLWVNSLVATANEQRQRRWNIAWRALLAICGGLVAGVALLQLDAVLHLGIGSKVRDFLGSATFRQLVAWLLTGAAPRCPAPCSTNLPPHLNPVDAAAYFAGVIYVSATAGFAIILEFMSAALLAGATNIVIGRLLTPAEVNSNSPATLRKGRVKLIAWLFAWSATVLFIADYVFNRTYGSSPEAALVGLQADGIALLFGTFTAFIAWFLVLVVAAADRQWGWVIGILVSTFGLMALLTAEFPILSPVVCAVFSTYVLTLAYLVVGPKQLHKQWG